MSVPAPPSDGTDFAPGTVFSHYRIVSVLGRGGMGVVYRAVDLQLEREVAIKCLRTDHDDPELRRRLLREAREAAKLSHPNVVAVHEVVDTPRGAAVVMELVAGESLRQRMRSGRPLPLEDVLRYTEELAGALDTAHDAGILHRDLTPNNVIVSRTGHAMLTDFGLVRRFAARTGSEGSTASDSGSGLTVAGTPGYFAPEQLLGRPLDPRSDLFSLGAVMYEMCTGTPAFPSSPEGEMIDAILHREPMAVTRLNYEVPAELERILRKALAKRPDERYQHARELETDVRALRRRTESVPVQTVRPSPRWAVWVVALLALTLAAGSVWWAASRFRSVPDDATLPGMTPRRLTSGAGREDRPAISPDGTFVAFSSDEQGNADLWLVDVGTAQPLQLTSGPALDGPASWLPDGSAIVYASRTVDGVSVWKVPRLGGPTTMLLPEADAPSVSPDGRRLAFTRPDADGNQRIWVARLDEPGTARQVSRSDGGVWDHMDPTWSPDGKRLCYSDFNNLWTVDAEGGPATRITSGPNRDRHCAWSRRTGHIYYSTKQPTVGGSTRALWRLAAPGETPQRITLGTGVEGEPSVSSDGRRLAYTSAADETRLVLVDLASGAREIVSRQPGMHSPTFTPDGAILYVSEATGELVIWRVDLQGMAPRGAPVRVTDLGNIGTFSLSPNGDLLAYHRALRGRRDILIASVHGGLPRAVTDDPASDVQPAWSPEGSRLAFASDRGGGQHLWVVTVVGGVPSGLAHALTSGSGTDSVPAWSRDGRSVAFVRQDGHRSEVWVVPADGSGPPSQVTRGAGASLALWTAQPGSLLVSGTWGGQDVRLRSVHLSDGKAAALPREIRFGDLDALGDFALSRDGRRLAFVEESSRGDIWLLQVDRGSF